jgi:HAD superfamily hydrolase (TIGR01459 family)
MTIEAPARFADIADRYDAVFCDLWGVVHNGRSVFAGVRECLRAFRAGGGTVVLISNVPKPRDPIFGQLARLGVMDDCYDAIVTSGDAIRAALAARAPGPYVRIGPSDDGVLWDGLDLRETSDLSDAAFIAISGLDDPLTETPEDYRARLALGVARDLELLCANPDLVVRVGDRLIACAGAVAQEYAAMGGRVVMAGKPHAPIYDLAFGELTRLRGPIVRSRVLCIGDGVITDVLGANAQGLDCLFIASGIHGETLKTDGVLDAAKVRAALTAEGAHARYVMAALA